MCDPMDDARRDCPSTLGGLGMYILNVLLLLGGVKVLLGLFLRIQSP